MRPRSICSHRCPLEMDGFPWWMIKPPGKPGIALDCSTKTTTKDTYDCSRYTWLFRRKNICPGCLLDFGMLDGVENAKLGDRDATPKNPLVGTQQGAKTVGTAR